MLGPQWIPRYHLRNSHRICQIFVKYLSNICNIWVWQNPLYLFLKIKNDLESGWLHAKSTGCSLENVKISIHRNRCTPQMLKFKDLDFRFPIILIKCSIESSAGLACSMILLVLVTFGWCPFSSPIWVASSGSLSTRSIITQIYLRIFSSTRSIITHIYIRTFSSTR